MPLDPRAKRFLDMLGAAGTSSAPTTIADRRLAFATLMRTAGGPPPDVAARDVTIPGAAGLLSARLYSPEETENRPGPGLVFFHGGGLVTGDLDTHHRICGRLALDAGCRVVSVAYRLAPEHPFPAAVADAWAAATAIFEKAGALGLDPQRIAVGGDSVGANLAASACQELARQGTHAVRAQLLICPVLDAGRQGQSHRLFRTDYFLDEATLDRDLMAYGGPRGLDPADPRVSPLRAADLCGLPPAIIDTAEYDPVRDDGAAYAERLRDAGVPVQYRCHPGMIHLFYGFGRLIPQGDACLASIGATLAAAL